MITSKITAICFMLLIAVVRCPLHLRKRMRKLRLEKATIQQLAGTPAHATAYLCDIHRNTARKWCHKFRGLIVQGLEKTHNIFEYEVALDKSYFEETRKRRRV